MADIKHVTLPNGDTHDIKDATIRDEVQYKIYDSVEDLGLISGSATVAGAWSAMSDGSILICQASEFSSTETPNPYGIIEIIRFNTSRGKILFYGKELPDGDYRMYLVDNAPSGTWVKNVAPVVQKFTSASQTLAAGGEGHVTINVAKTGYTPVGIIGITGSGNSGLYVTDFYIDGTTATLWYRNPGTASKTFTYTITVLYL